MPKRYNLFIDAQNVPARYIDSIIRYCQSTGYTQEEARLYASPDEIIRILAKTKTLLAENDIDPVPIPCKRGKNSVDIALAVDVIEGACEDHDDDVFIVVTNDSDFTHVASRVISYKSEFHLLYTGEHKPSGYSPKATIRRLEAPAAVRAPPPRPAVDPAAARPAAGRESRAPAAPGVLPYSETIPLNALPEVYFERRVADCSRVAIHSKSLFAAYMEFMGKRWKSLRSKKTAQEFADGFFKHRAYRFVPSENGTSNTGYFVSGDVGKFLVASPEGNEFYCLAGAAEAVLNRQAAVLAKAVSQRDHADFERLYDHCAEENVMPRYGAWALLRGWYQQSGVAKGQQNRQRPVPRQDVSPADILDGFHAVIRRQMENGELAFAIGPAGSAEAA